MASTERDLSTQDELIPTQFIRNFPFPGLGAFKKETIESALEFEPLDDDIIISTYPKTGTNWIKYLVWEIVNKGAPLPSTHDIHYVAAPFLELAGASVAQNLPHPRIVQFHLPYHLTPKNSSAKYIYMMRNPKDTLVSYFHFTEEVGGGKVFFNDYFEHFLEGKVWFGDYFDHVLSWYAHRDDPNILFLSYEQMKIDPRKELFRIAEHLGEKYLTMLKEDEEMTETILERTSFGYMKKNLDAQIPEKEITQKEKEEMVIPKFFRKGIIGDWKKHFSPEQNERLEKVISERFQGCDVVKFWDV